MRELREAATLLTLDGDAAAAALGALGQGKQAEAATALKALGISRLSVEQAAFVLSRRM